jgi:hypothetical protein
MLRRQRRQATSAGAPEEARTQATLESASPGSDVVEIVPVQEWRVCPSCLVVAQPEDVFCTTCGSELPALGNGPPLFNTPPEEAATATQHAWPESGPHEAEAPHLLAAPPAPHTVVTPPPRNRLWRRFALAVLFVLLAAALGTAVVGFHREQQAHRRALQALHTTRHTLAQTQAKLRATQASLRTTEILAARQRAILTQTGTVLKQVDPLLSNVDQLQQVTGEIQTARDTFATDAGTLVSDQITMWNDMIDAANANGWDVSYLNPLVDSVNNELATVRAEEGSLSAYDSDYQSASSRFSTRATTFTSSVRTLEAQLRKLRRSK